MCGIGGTTFTLNSVLVYYNIVECDATGKWDDVSAKSTETRIL